MTTRPALSVSVRTLAFAWVLVVLLTLRASAQGPLPGDLDPDFHPNVNGDVLVSAVQPDRGIVFGGNFTMVDGVARNRIARVSTAGVLDPTFDPDVDGAVRTIAILPDLGILIAGDFLDVGGESRENLALLRFDGIPDPFFTPQVEGKVHAVAVQGDGKILIGGEFTMVNSVARNHVARLNADGTLDMTFNPDVNGIVLTLALQDDGGVVLGGTFSMVSGQPRTRLARVNVAGVLDAGFAPNADGDVTASAVQADGKIVLSGTFNNVNSQLRVSAARLNANGTLDVAFNPFFDGTIKGMALQADGRLLFAGTFTIAGGVPSKYLARLEPDGSPESLIEIDPDAALNSVVIQVDGKLIICGSFQNVGGTARTRIARLSNTIETQFVTYPTPSSVRWTRGDAAPEVSSVTVDFFPTGGSAYDPLGIATRIPGGWEVTGITFPPSGFLRVRGNTRGVTNSIGVIEQIYLYPAPAAPTATTNPATSVATTGATLQATINPKNLATTAQFLFGTDPNLAGGTLTTATNVGSGINDVPFSFPVAGLIPGRSYYFRAVANNAFGTAMGEILAFSTVGPLPEPAFNPAPNAIVRTSAVQRDGAIVIGGDFISVSSTPHNNVARLLPNGSLDPTFNPNADGSVRAIAVQPDDSILIGGAFDDVGGAPHAKIARLLPNGTPDPAFQAAVDGTVRAIALQPDGKILVVGDFINVNSVPQPFLARLNANGTLDGSFAPVFDFAVSTVAVQADGKILVGGFFFNVNATGRRYLARLNANGTLDMGFTPGPGIISDLVQVVKVQADGKVLIGGDFIQIGAVPSNHVARLDVDGTLDSSFTAGTDATVTTIALLADGRTLIGGGFNQVNGETRRGIAQLLADSSVDLPFNPDATGGSVSSIAVQGDGKVVFAGSFTNVAGTPAPFIARVANGAIVQQITVANSSTVRWLRDAGSPEVEQVTFEFAPDGINYVPLGAATRIVGGWELTGQSLPLSGTIRARGVATSGSANGSSGIIENSAVFDLGLPSIGVVSADGVTSISAMLHASINPNGQDTTGYFEYGTDPTLADASSTTGVGLGAGNTPIQLDQAATPLNVNTQYYFRAVASNASGTSRSGIFPFTTGNNPPVVITSPNFTVFAQPDGNIVVNIGAQFLSDQPATGAIQISLDPGFGTIEYERLLGAVSGEIAIGIGSAATYIFAPATTYYYRATATNASGTTIGAVLSFVTPGVPPPVLDTTLPVPNEPAGTTFLEFASPAVDAGRVGGLAIIRMPNGKSQSIIFGGANGAVLARTGGIAPNGATFIQLGDPVFGGDAFGFAAKSRAAAASPLARLSSPAETSAAASRAALGLWSQRSSISGLEQIAVQGGLAPGAGAGKFSKIAGFGLPRSRAGLVFLAKLGIGPGVMKGTETGIWRERPEGGVDLLLRSGTQIEMNGGGVRSLKRALFMNSVQQAPDQRRGFTSNGEIAASATFADGSSGIVRVAADGTTDIPVDSTTPVPELSGAEFASFGSPATASGGRFAVLARLRAGAGGVTAKDDQQIFASLDAGGLRPVLRRGATLPGTGTARIDRVGEPLLGEGGLIGLVAALKGKGVNAKNREAIIVHSVGKSMIAARLGEQAHGLGQGILYQRFLSVVVTDAPQARLVFTATLAGPGINKRNRQGAWCVTPAGTVRLLLRLGDTTKIGSETPSVTLIDALKPKPSNRGQGRGTDASGFFTARIKLSDLRTGLLRIPLP